MGRELSPLDAARAGHRPLLPQILERGVAGLTVAEGAPTTASEDPEEIRQRFPRTYGRPQVELRPGSGLGRASPLRVGVVLSGGQAPGGHNVIAGLLDGLRAVHPDSRLFGFRDGPRGVVDGSYVELTAERVEPYRNTGGFDMIGSGRDKIETESQQAASRETCAKLGLDALVIVGGDDSNTNAAVLAEYFLECGETVSVLGVPKTIDGDLKGGGIEASFGFDTATRVFASLIGNICRDAASSRKYWHFVRLMGRSASHVTLECALQTRPNLTLIAEEIERDGMTLDQVVDRVAEAIHTRAVAGKNYGVCLVPEGLIEFIPELRALFAELNPVLADHAGEFDALPGFKPRRDFVASKLTEAGRTVFDSLPERIQRQLLIDRDEHGNVQVSKIDTELLLIEKIKDRVERWRKADEFPGTFKAQGHFFGYEGRAANPTDFDAGYTYALGYVAALLSAARRTGYICAVGNLAAPPGGWVARGVPMTSLMRMERRKGKDVPVIGKALVELDGAPFAYLAAKRDAWAAADAYLYPGTIQYFGPPAVTAAPAKTLLLERNGSEEPPDWLTGDG